LYACCLFGETGCARKLPGTSDKPDARQGSSMTLLKQTPTGSLSQQRARPGTPSMTPETDNRPEETPDSQTDLQLVRKVRNGDRAAFDLLVIKYQSRVASII